MDASPSSLMTSGHTKRRASGKGIERRRHLNNGFSNTLMKVGARNDYIQNLLLTYSVPVRTKKELNVIVDR
jgi:hypothetical protein